MWRAEALWQRAPLAVAARSATTTEEELLAALGEARAADARVRHGPPSRARVYRRAGRPCARCGATILAAGRARTTGSRTGAPAATRGEAPPAEVREAWQSALPSSTSALRRHCLGAFAYLYRESRPRRRSRSRSRSTPRPVGRRSTSTARSARSYVEDRAERLAAPRRRAVRARGARAASPRRRSSRTRTPAATRPRSRRSTARSCSRSSPAWPSAAAASSGTTTSSTAPTRARALALRREARLRRGRAARRPVRRVPVDLGRGLRVRLAVAGEIADVLARGERAAAARLRAGAGAARA